MIYIDFQAGMHGNYLQFVCNRLLANVACVQEMPFTELGSAHDWQWLEDPVFRAGHFSLKQIPIEHNSSVVSIRCDESDLLPIQCVSLLRAGERNIDPQYLHIDTFHKLNNEDYAWVLDNITRSFFHQQIVDSYQAVSDPSWPTITSLEDFQLLPQDIRQECIDVHHLELLQLDQDHPDCPQWVLREFFRIGFLDPANHGFMRQQNLMTYHASHPVFTWKFAWFYDPVTFEQNLNQLADWCGLSMPADMTALRTLHAQFLQRQIFRDSKTRCDRMVQAVINETPFDLSELNVIEQAYVEAELQQHTGRAIPICRDHWYPNTLDLSRSIWSC